ncbi:MAG: polysaccharide biosynthesis tyrosine autokinase [Acidobacteria bacterium]|nr:polysaccharide biosynthesis tyrosine autokinase [Acidobacteriota bacterium]
MAEDKNKNDRTAANEEALLIRPSGAPTITSLDQLSAYNNYYNPGVSAEGFNVREIWRKIRKRKWLILAIVFIATTVVTIESFRNKSLFMSTAKIAVNKDNALIKAGDFVLQTDDSERINTEILMLQTRPLLEEVVVRLRLDQNPKFLDVGGRKSVFESISTIFSKFGTQVPTQQTQLPSFESLVVEPAPDGRRSAEDSEKLDPYVEILQNYLQVTQVPATRAIEVRFTHTDPRIAASVANGVAYVFVENSFKNKTETSNNTASWLDKTTRSLQTQMQQSEQALATYSNTHNIFSMDEKSNLSVEKLADIYGQALKAETDRILKQSVYEEVKKGRVAQLPEAFSDSKTTQYQQKLADMQLKAAELNARFGPENPKVTEIQGQVEQLQNLIASGTKNLEEKLKADFERATREEKLIKESLEKAKLEAIEQNQSTIQFNLLKQNVDTNKLLYNDFLQKTNQANLQKLDQNKDLRVIEDARPGTLTGPRRVRSIMLGLILSLMAGIGLSLLLDYLDNTVRNVEDVARATQLPTLALIPSMNAQSMKVLSSRKKAELKEVKEEENKKKATTVTSLSEGISGLAPRSMQNYGNKIATLDGMSSVVEAYRMLRTSVLLSTAGNPPKTILITSSQPGEGKTTTAVNTAISLAQLGAKVLLIDADLRRPTVHKTFKLQHARGLSSYLSGRSRVEDMIIKLSTPNLSILPSGPIPPNPAELISSDRMKDMLRHLSETYDHIVIDSPPLINVTDPVILSTMVDGSIIVVQAGRSTKDLIRRARQELSGVGAKVFGVVLNNVDVKREGYDEYYYHRYYSNYIDNQKGTGAA